jgi:hypothetical protein
MPSRLPIQGGKPPMFTLVFLVTYLPTALAAGPAMTSSTATLSVSLYSVSGDQRWRQIDFGVAPPAKKRSRREVLAAWLQSVRADGV